jgi:hypothetical protein
MTDKDAAKVRRELLAVLRRLVDGPLTLEAGLRASALQLDVVIRWSTATLLATSPGDTVPA